MALTALVTGGNRGLGLAVCRALGAAGVRVLLGSRDAAAGQAAAAELVDAGSDVRPVAIDVADPAGIDRALAGLQAVDLAVDILVNNAGVLTDGDALGTPEEAFREAFEVHVFGPLRLARALVPGMRARGMGRVVNLSSGYGSFGEGGIAESPSSYGVSKAALNALTVSLAAAAGPAVKVNAVCPGWVRTRMGGPEAPRAIEEAVDGIVWLATLPDDGPTGGFFRDRQPIPW